MYLRSPSVPYVSLILDLCDLLLTDPHVPGSLSLWITERRNMGCEFDRRSPGFHRQPLAAIKDHALPDEKKVEEGPKTA